MDAPPKSAFSRFAAVIVEKAVGKTLDYGIPEPYLCLLKRGSLVKVLLRGKEEKGIVYEIKASSDCVKVLPISAVCNDESAIPEDLFDLALWMARYYFAPLHQLLKMLLPTAVRAEKKHKEQFFVHPLKSSGELREIAASLRDKSPSQALVLDQLLIKPKGLFLTELLEKTLGSKSPVETLCKKGLLSFKRLRVDRSPLIGEEYFKTKAKELTEQQKAALNKIISSLEKRTFATHLLFGVTGSGKTEVYLQAIDYALKKGLATIMLLPEIALTTQMIERFRSRFEDNIAVLHYRLSQGERFDEWHRIRRGEAKIVIGARSALFSPVPKLGLVIVDEEHESAYKQSDEAPRYHARDVAVMRGKMSQSTVILGSATPSIESFFNAVQGKYVLSPLRSRIQKAQMPHITIVDMRKEFEKAQGFTPFSSALIEGIKKRVSVGEQILIFLNRRGYHTTISCKACGHIFKCPHCDLSLTLHRTENKLCCHLCEYTLSSPPQRCPQGCGQEMLKYSGMGTEQVERALHAILPDVRTLRMDSDTTRHKGSHERALRSFSTGKSDVLIGTQMIAKGLHFPSVTLVAIIDSDGALNIPDFRASEQVFSLITQVSGRAGRGELAGEVLIQTKMPENNTLCLAAEQDYEAFFAQELLSRKTFGFPPYTRIIKFTFTGHDASLTSEAGEKFRSTLSTLLNNRFFLHPLVPSGHPKIKDLYRFQFLLRGNNLTLAHDAINKLLGKAPLPRKVFLAIDVDPLSTFF